MVFINYERKAIFIHNPKCGGAYVRDILLSDYGFQPFVTGKHADLADFMDTPDQIDTVVNDKHTIRRHGKVRYFLTHQDTIEKQGALKDYFKFAFVRNPYARLVSAYKYCKKALENSCRENPNIRGLAENPLLYTDFATFIRHFQQVNNIAFFHAFITQCDQLMDETGGFQIDYIGRTENLDEEFLEILEKIGISEIKHANLLFFDQKINQTTEDDVDITLLYDEETLAFTNTFFQRDFEVFGYVSYDSLQGFRENYGCEKSKNLENLFFRKKMECIKYKCQLQSGLLKKYRDMVDMLIDIVVDAKIIDVKTLDTLHDGIDLMNEKRLHLTR